MTDTMSTSPDPDTASEAEATTPAAESSMEQSKVSIALGSEPAGVGTRIERNDIMRSRSDGSAAARLSGERFARLLYGPRVEEHVAPYSVISPANPRPRDERQA